MAGTGRAGGINGGVLWLDAPDGSALVFFTATRHVGGQIGVGTGMAFTRKKYKGTDGATLRFFGGMAVGPRNVSRILNMAALWKLPVISLPETIIT